MNGVVGGLGRVVHVSEPMTLELQLFGSIPTLVLQQFYRMTLLDYICAFFYSLHFIAVTVFGFLLWKYRSQNFSGYVLALGIGTYAALITFLLYPVAPPWYGAGATRILLQVDQSIGIPFYRTVFDFVESNPFAAFPSLHAMYPWLISLYSFKIKKAKALPVLVFPIGVWFSAVYLGEHYIIDIIGGVVYGTCAFLLADKLIPMLIRDTPRRAKVFKPEALS
jgi:membrane-associated phospholipid phosphatase